MKPPRNLGAFEEQLKQQVYHQLLRNFKADSNDIMVIVQRDVVILEGSVPTDEARRHAAELTLVIPGVRDVRNHLRVPEPVE